MQGWHTKSHANRWKVVQTSDNQSTWYRCWLRPVCSSYLLAQAYLTGSELTSNHLPAQAQDRHSRACRKPTLRRAGCLSNLSWSMAASHQLSGCEPKWRAHQAGGRTRALSTSARAAGVVPQNVAHAAQSGGVGRQGGQGHVRKTSGHRTQGGRDVGEAAQAAQSGGAGQQGGGARQTDTGQRESGSRSTVWRSGTAEEVRKTSGHRTWRAGHQGGAPTRRAAGRGPFPPQPERQGWYRRRSPTQHSLEDPGNGES